MEGHLCRRMLVTTSSHINEKRNSYELRKSEKRVYLELKVDPKKIQAMTETVGGVEFLGPTGPVQGGAGTGPGRYRVGPGGAKNLTSPYRSGPMVGCRWLTVGWGVEFLAAGADLADGRGVEFLAPGVALCPGVGG